MLLSERIRHWIKTPALHISRKRRKRLSYNAVDTYAVYMRHFGKWMGEETLVEAITSERLEAFAAYLELPQERGGCGYRPRTVRLAWRAVCTLHEWLVHEGSLPSHIAIPKVYLPSLDVAIRELVSEVEVRACFQACERILDPYRCALSRAIFHVLIGTCVRNFELRAFDLSDLDLERSSLNVRHGKGNKQRMVPLNNDAKAAMRAWLQVRPANCKHQALFCQDIVSRVGERGLIKLVREIAAIAGYKGATNIMPHSLRHFGATKFYRRTNDLHATMTLLGHSSLQTTQLYLHTGVEDLHKLRNFTGVESPLAPSCALVETPAATGSQIPTIPPSAEVETHLLLPQRFKH